jgi:uncharacterized protein (DUF2062 family)
VLRPLLRALRGGVTPRRLAWSLALGMVVGVNPSVGLTTLLVVLVAWVFGLSKFASLIGSHVVAPLHLLLFIPFIDLGVHLFHTRKLPMDRKQLEHLSHHPLRLFHDIWQWEWHALIVWAVVAAVAMPLMAVYLRRMLIVLMRRNRTLIRSRPAVKAHLKFCDFVHVSCSVHATIRRVLLIAEYDPNRVPPAGFRSAAGQMRIGQLA